MIKNLPIIGGVIELIAIYIQTTAKLVKNRKDFLIGITPFSSQQFKKSMKYFEFGIVVGFLFLVPFHVIHSESPSKFIFVVRQIIAIMLYSYAIHIAFKLLKVNSSFRTIAILMGYVWGLMFPLIFIIFLPALIEIGPSFIFEGINSEWAYDANLETLRKFTIIGTLGGIVFIIVWLRYVLTWLSAAYNIKKGKVLAALILGGLPSGLIIGFILGPIFKVIEKSLGNWLLAF